MYVKHSKWIATSWVSVAKAKFKHEEQYSGCQSLKQNLEFGAPLQDMELWALRLFCCKGWVASKTFLFSPHKFPWSCCLSSLCSVWDFNWFAIEWPSAVCVCSSNRKHYYWHLDVFLLSLPSSLPVDLACRTALSTSTKSLTWENQTQITMLWVLVLEVT